MPPFSRSTVATCSHGYWLYLGSSEHSRVPQNLPRTLPSPSCPSWTPVICAVVLTMCLSVAVNLRVIFRGKYFSAERTNQHLLLEVKCH